jgi:hypothetical protein
VLDPGAGTPLVRESGQQKKQTADKAADQGAVDPDIL